MGSTYRFIADPSQQSEVVDWFRARSTPPIEVQTERSLILYFKDIGPLTYHSNGAINPKTSPVVTVFLPRVRRGALWTVGEVHFLATPLRQQYPALYKISSAFLKWLANQECVFSNKDTNNKFAYYLEGSIKNYDTPVFAFESGLRALESENYFVADDDNDAKLEQICKSLLLRGVKCHDI
ncbi:hypothetical protein ACO0LD_03375 [Undibacterium sp. Ji83W]|uniref:hypothetical protein n=1 Tax=Undibacterium sp. Ji83W TaxID=3413043 RepID=UPI003BF00431